jgi:two-component system response regulator
MSRSLQIFLAEDNPGDVELVRESLREHDLEYQLSLVSDGAEAKRYIARMGESPDAPRPDLLLLDLNLPKADGCELIAMFHAHPLCTHTPVIVVTSSNARADRERAAALGAARYFRKPSELKEFLQLGAVIRELATEMGLC